MYKNRMWNQIKDNTDTTDDIRRILMVSLRTKWKEAKHEAKTSRYDPYDTDIERLAHSLVNVEEYQWRSLVHYWSSEDAKHEQELAALVKKAKPTTTDNKGILMSFCTFYIVVILHLYTLTNVEVVPAKHFVESFNRTSFPFNFIFGAASAAYQVIMVWRLWLSDDENDKSLEIFSPNLQHLKISGGLFYLKCRLVDVSYVVNAKLTFKILCIKDIHPIVQVDDEEDSCCDYHQVFRTLVQEYLQMLISAIIFKI
ncbi:hypothetical protein FXO38_30643 [Capsicum annuum]|nr:hypothetical protein FXO38_30643 [Capsicum annuum]